MSLLKFVCIVWAACAARHAQGAAGSGSGSWALVSGLDEASCNGVYVCRADSTAGCENLETNARLLSAFTMVNGTVQRQWRLHIDGRDLFASSGEASDAARHDSTPAGFAAVTRWRDLQSRKLVSGARMLVTVVMDDAPNEPPVSLASLWARLQTGWIHRPDGDPARLPMVLHDMLLGPNGAVRASFDAYVSSLSGAVPGVVSSFTNSFGVPLADPYGRNPLAKLRGDLKRCRQVQHGLSSLRIGSEQAGTTSLIDAGAAQLNAVVGAMARLLVTDVPASDAAPLHPIDAAEAESIALSYMQIVDSLSQSVRQLSASSAQHALPPALLQRSSYACLVGPLAALALPGGLTEPALLSDVLALHRCLVVHQLAQTAHRTLVIDLDPHEALAASSKVAKLIAMDNFSAPAAGLPRLLAVHAVSAVLTGTEEWNLLPLGVIRCPEVFAMVTEACPKLLVDWQSIDRSTPALGTDLLYRSCGAVERLLRNDELNVPFDEARSLATALLAVGAPMAAAGRAAAAVGLGGPQQASPEASNKCSDCETAYLQAMHQLVDEARFESYMVLMSARRLGLFLVTLLELAAPVVLSAGPQAAKAHCWAVETAELHRLALRTLDHLTDICRHHPVGCAADIDDAAHATMGGRGEGSAQASDAAMTVHSAVGSRGLFLLAYQGANLVFTEDAPLCSPATAIMDGSIPRVYFELLQVLGPAMSRSTLGVAAVKRVRGLSLRVAFLSPFFHEHSIGRLFQYVVVGLSHRYRCAETQRAGLPCLHITLVHASPGPAADGPVRRSLEAAADDVIQLPYQPNRALTILTGLRLDVLVFTDLYMDPLVTLLGSFRSAPVQVAFWGHPYSSGLDTIDYFISSEGYEPVFREIPLRKDRRKIQFSEQLVVFETVGAMTAASEAQLALLRVFDIPVKHHEVPRAEIKAHWAAMDKLLLSRTSDIYGNAPYDPAQHLWLFCASVDANPASANYAHGPWCNITNSSRTGPTPLSWWLQNYFTVRVGCLQMIMKMHPLLDDTIVQILVQNPRALVFLLNNLKQPRMQGQMMKRLLGKIEAAGVNPFGVIFINEMPKADYERVLCTMSVSLDTVPFGGGVTLWDSLHCGVSFVTAPNLQSVHALGAGIAASYSMNQGSIGIGGVVSAASDTFAASTEQLARCALSVGLGSADGVPGCITRFDALNVLTGRSPVVGEEASNLNNPNGIVEEMVDEWFAFLMRIGFDYDQSFL